MCAPSFDLRALGKFSHRGSPTNYSPRTNRRNHLPENIFGKKRPIYSPASLDSAPNGELIARQVDQFDAATPWAATNFIINARYRWPELFATSPQHLAI
jgi:hypothetical protein